MEHEKKSNTLSYVTLGVVGMLLVVSLFQAVALSSVTSSLQAGGVSMKGIDASTSQGETYEQMMARMHPDQVQPQGAASSGSGMVGGC